MCGESRGASGLSILILCWLSTRGPRLMSTPKNVLLLTLYISTIDGQRCRVWPLRKSTTTSVVLLLFRRRFLLLSLHHVVRRLTFLKWVSSSLVLRPNTNTTFESIF